MNVNVKHALPRSLSTIYDHAKSPLFQLFFPRQLGGHKLQMSHQTGIIVRKIQQCGNVLARDYEKVRGRLRIYVPYRHRTVVREN